MLVVDRFVNASETCSYLGDRPSRTAYEYVAELTPEEYERRMNEGWRKFGRLVFKPVCAACQECRPVRVPVAEFTPDRGQRRVLRRNADLTVTAGPPDLDAEHLALYYRYHAARSEAKGWPEQAPSAEEYALTFLDNPLPAIELQVRRGETLVAFVHLDMTPNVISAIYHVHAPELAERSLGTFSILQTLDYARAAGRAYVYLGYYVAGCGSMAYKARFKPCEFLSPQGEWRR